MSKLFKQSSDTQNGRLFETWSFSKYNYIYFGIGLLLIIIGYFVMASGEVNSFQSLTLAPIMLFAGYIIFI
ncbi:MAG: DUF3098 domain-containing protein, partial [Candidatus Marinimicrobia bacterium]|nr:DUF3098 domain-containing protein [Candidatus Neomarinimicrobiota bacterium]MBT3692316.1 DUF3098 domain-containing protein [Candidatus Neomarinimicrobiota bacterium]MBT4177368.1 DUF3098 domain-containing protein [Candidatus Neomarinimicrobiota bacterium]MBT4593186.1 DUF3098 domain-containing protein [Candidatus Neomarinimicrobiota bacterium]MBT6158998.1 DUF3098 domain-containing protein [Candidatus Neomarinimicrobiota bacterium]